MSDDPTPRITDSDRTPGGLAGNRVFGPGEGPPSYHSPELEARLARPRPPDIKGLKWWQQPGHLQQRDDG